MKKILFVSHDANRAGAQLFLLNVVKYLSQNTEWKCTILFLKDGNLLEEFKKYSDVLFMPKNKSNQIGILPKNLKRLYSLNDFKRNKQTLINELNTQNFDLIYANTVATSSAFSLLKILEKPIISHFHELPFSINLYSKKADLAQMLESSNAIIGCSDAVSKNLVSNYLLNSEKVKTIHSFVNNDEILNKISNIDAQNLRVQFNIPLDKKIIISCGNAEFRKGVDLFIEVAKAFNENSDLKNNVVFVWVGIHKKGELYDKCVENIEKFQIQDLVILIEPTPFAQELISISTIFALTSREDPFPLVMLEAAVCSKTLIGFAESGGAAEFIEKDAGVLVQGFDTEKMASEIDFLLKNENKSILMGEIASKKTKNLYNFATSMKKIEALINLNV